MINIFLESKNDSTPEYKFVAYLLQFLGIDPQLYDIIPLNGKDTLHLAKNQFIQNTVNGGTNLIVFDADTEENNGGYEKRKEELIAKLAELNIVANIFLWPDDSHDGDFETMLESLARKDLHSQFFGCFNDYELCLGHQYIRPNRKGKLHTYVTSMKLSNKQRRNIGSGDWLFDNKDLWNMDSDNLLPLKSFLKYHFRI